MKITKEVLSGVTIAGIFALVILFILALANVGSSRNEVVECNEWQKEASQYDSFFLLKWQDEQCRAHGITIVAPVR